MKQDGNLEKSDVKHVRVVSMNIWVVFKSVRCYCVIVIFHMGEKDPTGGICSEAVPRRAFGIEIVTPLHFLPADITLIACKNLSRSFKDWV